MENNGAVYILASYYELSQQGFMVNLYHYIGGGVLQQMPSFPQNITTTAATALPAWIHLDAHNLNEFIITWQENGLILAKAGTANSSFVMGNTAILDNSSIVLVAASQPDVALINSQQSGGKLMAHFVYTDQSRQRLVAASLPYLVILNTPIPLAPVTPIFDDQQNVNGAFIRPRIDAPDSFDTDDWSYVVREKTNTNQDLIFTRVMHGSILSHYNLNDGSLGILTDISSAVPPQSHENRSPVVAYADNGKDIYFCWYYYSQYEVPPTSNNYDYIGLKIHNYGTLIGSQSKYWQIPFFPNRTIAPIGTLALSEQNTNSPGLFMTFLQIANTGLTSMTSKVIPWTQTSFRPGHQTTILSIDSSSSFSLSPNPFSRYFQIKASPDNHQVYHLQLSDELGREILQLEGNISQLNQKLATPSLAQLPSGNYFLNISGKGGERANFKLVKIK